MGKKDKKVYYVGRTNNVLRRSREHYNDKYPQSQYTVMAVATGMSYRQARAMEQNVNHSLWT